MWLILLAIILVLFNFFPKMIFIPHVFNFGSILFPFYHASMQHLTMNLLTLFLAYIIAKTLAVDEKKLILTFFISSYIIIPIANMFDLKIVGASAGIYGMIGYMLQDMARLTNPFIIFAILLSTILFDFSDITKWEKLLHLIGFLTGMAVRSMERPYSYEKIATVMSKEGYYE